jgi:hypothetical protein
MGSMAWGVRLAVRPAADDEPPVVFRGYTAESLAEQIREHEARQP